MLVGVRSKMANDFLRGPRESVTLNLAGEVSNGWLETCKETGERRAGMVWEE